MALPGFHVLRVEIIRKVLADAVAEHAAADGFGRPIQIFVTTESFLF